MRMGSHALETKMRASLGRGGGRAGRIWQSYTGWGTSKTFCACSDIN